MRLETLDQLMDRCEPEVVQEIKTSKESGAALAKKFGVTPQAISYWRHA